jgi:hypothetical protein
VGGEVRRALYMGYEAMREQTLARQKKIHLGGNDG